jgi:serine/threonine protein phosphatase PrpC
MAATPEQAQRRTEKRFLEHWATHWIYPGEYSALTPHAAAFGMCGRSVQAPQPDPDPVVQGFTFRPEHDFFAVGRGVGASEGAGKTGYWALAIGLHEMAESANEGGDEPEAAIRGAAQSVAEHLRNAAKVDAIFENAGCAVTALWLSAARPTLVHAGDCLAVRLRGGTAQPLTVEHTLERDSREKGIPIASPYIRSVLLRLLGAFDAPRGEPEILAPDLAPDDRVLLLSTDAATRLANVDLSAALEGTPAEAGRRLLTLALARKAPEAAVVVIDLM